MKRPRLPMWGTLAGLVVGVAITAGLMATGTIRIPQQRDLSDASGEFLVAWERNLRGTFVVRSDFRRTLADGRTLYSATEHVQRPPDELVRQFGGIDGSLNGHPVVCSTDPTGRYSCTTGTADSPPFEQRVQAEMDRFRSYFSPPAPGALALYRVVRGVDPGCFELFEQIPYPNPVYGHYAKFCFDATTGAFATFERHLDDDVVESRIATSIHADVTPLDFDLQQDDSFDVRMDLGPAPIRSAPTTVAGPTGTVPTPSEVELAQLSDEAVISEGSARFGAGQDAGAYTREAVQRVVDGRLSINDPLWRDASNSPVPLAGPVVHRLLELGYLPPVPN